MVTTKKPMRIFGLHVLSDTSNLGKKTRNIKYSIRDRICPLGFEKCFAARDSEIFDVVCQGNFDSCQNYINNYPVSEEKFALGAYAIQFYTKDGAIALSGAKEKN